MILKTHGLTKRYGPVAVLSDIDFDVRRGEVHALLGANGAGKSTLCKIIAGLTPASAGTMHMDERDYLPANKQGAEQHGIEIVQQELNLIANLSVAENLFLTRLPTTCGVLRYQKLHRDAREVLDRFGLPDVPTHAPVFTLGVGHQQMVEIASALARDCKLLILDEPTAALSATESQQLFAHLRNLREHGVAIVYISHRLDEVAELSDRITVLRDGKLVTTQPARSLSTDEMVELMSGQQNVSSRNDHVDHRSDAVVLHVDSLSRGPVQDVSFVVRRGQRLGITGLVGSGRTELLRAIFGADVAETGSVTVGEGAQSTRFTHPANAVAAGMAMVTEDRKQNGLLLSQSIRVNTTLASLADRFARFGVLRRQAESDKTTALRESLEIRCESIEQVVGTLSGGNQQKVAVAKWLVRDGEVFLFDEPTRGIDVAARRRIYRLFATLAAAGKGLVIVSSDLDELFETCDTIAVMSAGRLTALVERDSEHPEDPWDYERIMRASFSGSSR